MTAHRTPTLPCAALPCFSLHGRRAPRHRRAPEPRLLPVALAAMLTVAGFNAAAQPAPTQLPVRNATAPINAVVGPVTGTTNPAMTITQTPSATNRAVVEWSTFSVGSAATVNITQPNAQSVLVNRVVNAAGPSPSEIYGTLNANGRVFIVNPGGVVFGAGAQVNVGSLVAASLDLTNAMTADSYKGLIEGSNVGLYTSGTPGALEVRETATITTTAGGSVVLIGGQGVLQNGVIEAAQGRIKLAAAAQAQVLSLSDSGFVDLAITQSVASGTLTTGINSRTFAAGGQIEVGGNDKDSARSRTDVLDINGTLSTASSTSHGGSVRIDAGDGGTTTLRPEVTVSAASTAAGGSGGSIDVQGRTIVIEPHSAAAPPVRAEAAGRSRPLATATHADSLNASGPAQGGTITVGNERTTALTLASGAVINADATTNGDGGTITLRATYYNPFATGPVARFDYGVAEVYGTLQARGGSVGGNGGHIETSGTALATALTNPSTGITVAGVADARARHASGRSGSWTLDPFDVTISNAGPTSVTGSFAPSGPGATVRAADISAALDAGTSVEVSTGSATSGTAVGNITVEAGTTITRSTLGGPATTLTLRAHNDVLLQTGSVIEAANGSSLGVSLLSDLDGSGAGRVALDGARISTGGGNVLISGGSTPGTGAARGDGVNAGVSLQSATLDTVGTSTRGDITLRGTGATDGSDTGIYTTNSSLTARNITLFGRSSQGSGLSLNATNISTDSGAVDLRGVATRVSAAGGQSIGAEVDGLNIDLGTGSLTLAGRGDDSNIVHANPSATGLQYSELRITTSPTASGTIQLAGESANTAPAAGGVGIQFQDRESGGLSISAIEGSTLSNISLGALSATGAALDLGDISLASVNTSGSINFRPVSVSTTGALDDQTAQPILVTGTPAASGFSVYTPWLENLASGGLHAGQGFVVGSSNQTGNITVATGALTNHNTVSLTLQNQGTGSGGISLGGGNTVLNLGLLTEGNVSQTGALTTAGNLVIAGGTSSTINLTQAGNQIGGVLAFDPPATLNVTTLGNLTIDAASIARYNASTGAYTPLSLTTSVAGTNTTLRSTTGNVLVNQSITTTAIGASLNVVSPTRITFAPGATLSAAAGVARAWAPSVVGLAATNLYGCAFGDVGSCSVSGIALPTRGVQALSALQPTLSIVATGIATSYTSAGFINGDTEATSLTGALAVSGDRVVQGSLSSPTGYLINFTDALYTPIDVNTVRASHLSDFNTSVYGRNLSWPFVCTTASAIREGLAGENKADPLTSEWGKVRSQPQLSGCLDVSNGGQCAAF